MEGKVDMKNRSAALVTLLLLSYVCSGQTVDEGSGKTVWADVSDGRLKAQVFETEEIGLTPILLIVLHGDLLGPQSFDPYHYQFAREVAARTSNVVAAGLLRPGYSDAFGDRSDGEPFLATGDNYTATAVDAVADATEYLRSEYRARAVLVVGHSGGAAITALMLGRRPEVADAAVLAACPCDLPAWREHMMAELPNPIWRQPIDGLSPLDFAAGVRPSTIVELFVGRNDRVVLPEYTEAYADALRRQDVDVRSTVLPDLEHEILLQPAVIERAVGSIARL